MHGREQDPVRFVYSLMIPAEAGRTEPIESGASPAPGFPDETIPPEYARPRPAPLHRSIPPESPGTTECWRRWRSSPGGCECPGKCPPPEGSSESELARATLLPGGNLFP